MSTLLKQINGKFITDINCTEIKRINKIAMLYLVRYFINGLCASNSNQYQSYANILYSIVLLLRLIAKAKIEGCHQKYFS